jgi:serine/threonine-protein kinase
MTTAMAARAAVAVGVGRLVSSDSVPVGGLTPGSVLAGRYRIIGLLGRGGMGEVYRADDLKLGQPVALKFLPGALSSDPVRRERFFAEVRITRQLAHPNICRVYDIAEVDGQHFLSMEFIDGEDLASLLKRIGYLPNEKALEIARQLLAGLAAAHERGVLHRDLKPSNIMLDGHGRVRITDFGLAIATTESDQPVGDVSGTPAYMAPEQLAGKGATVRSDVYSLGLVLYEILSGKKAFTSLTIAALREEKEQSTPTAPSELRAGVDPIVERIVMRCLERDPRARPASVAQLAAALPGGDPLAAAIAAGETPSPELVAASGLKEGLRPAAAIALLAVVVAGSLAAVGMNRRTVLMERVPPGKPPDVLLERAREIVRRAGYVDEPADFAFGFDYDNELIRYIERTDRSSVGWSSLPFSPITFWYRQSPRPLERSPFLNWTTVTAVDPPLQFAGEAIVAMDAQGRLKRFDAIPSRARTAAGTSRSFDWAGFLSEAAFDSATLTSSAPRSIPATFADEQRSWTGTRAASGAVPMQVEAAAYAGRPVTFHIVGPWTADEQPDATPARSGNLVGVWTLLVLALTVMSGSVFYARRNLRLGRGDRRGALRLMVVLLCLGMLAWVLSEHHVPTPWEFALFLTALSTALYFTGMIGVLYIAFEPFVRRRWPQVLVSWTRVIMGAWGDPLVGRDLLIGLAVGVAVTCSMRFETIVPSWFGYSDGTIVAAPMASLLGPLAFVNTLVQTVASTTIFFGLVEIFLLFFLRMIVRIDWVALAAWVAVQTVAQTLGRTSGGLAVMVGPIAIVGPIVAIENLLLILVLKRFGLFAFMAAELVVGVFANFPITLQTSAWYAGYGYAALGVVGAIALYGFKTSLGGQSLVAAASIDD